MTCENSSKITELARLCPQHCWMQQCWWQFANAKQCSCCIWQQKLCWSIIGPTADDHDIYASPPSCASCSCVFFGLSAAVWCAGDVGAKARDDRCCGCHCWQSAHVTFVRYCTHKHTHIHRHRHACACELHFLFNLIASLHHGVYVLIELNAIIALADQMFWESVVHRLWARDFSVILCKLPYTCVHVCAPIDIYSRVIASKLKVCARPAVKVIWDPLSILFPLFAHCAHSHLNTQFHLKKYTYANFISHVNLCDFIFFNDYSACGGGVCCLSAAQCGSSSRFVLILLRKKTTTLAKLSVFNQNEWFFSCARIWTASIKVIKVICLFHASLHIEFVMKLSLNKWIFE